MDWRWSLGSPGARKGDDPGGAVGRFDAAAEEVDAGFDWVDNEGELTQCTRESVRDATLAAFEGGAEGVVLSRKYSEMLLENVSGPFTVRVRTAARQARFLVTGMDAEVNERDGWITVGVDRITDHEVVVLS